MRSGLHARLARLEARQRLRAPLSPVLIAMYPDDCPGELVGASAKGAIVTREAGEPQGAFVVRASALLGQRLICGVYQ
jgi:hypothetical protein